MTTRRRHRRSAALAGAAGIGLLLAPAAAAPRRTVQAAAVHAGEPAAPALPGRLRLVVLHTLGGPDYGRPERRWTFLTPEQTFGLWRRPGFGTHWIVWRDGSIWPRRKAAGEGDSFVPPAGGELTRALAERLVRHAGPVLSHVAGANSRSLGIEVAHSGRSDDPFPEDQVRALAWLLRSLFELSLGRLGPASVVGHKDMDRQPAWEHDRCPDLACPVYADDEGRPYRRRVDPPESLFAALAREGVRVPRVGVEGDLELLRAQAIPEGREPATAEPPAAR